MRVNSNKAIISNVPAIGMFAPATTTHARTDSIPSEPANAYAATGRVRKNWKNPGSLVFCVKLHLERGKFVRSVLKKKIG